LLADESHIERRNFLGNPRHGEIGLVALAGKQVLSNDQRGGSPSQVGARVVAAQAAARRRVEAFRAGIGAKRNRRQEFASRDTDLLARRSQTLFGSGDSRIGLQYTLELFVETLGGDMGNRHQAAQAAKRQPGPFQQARANPGHCRASTQDAAQIPKGRSRFPATVFLSTFRFAIFAHAAKLPQHQAFCQTTLYYSSSRRATGFRMAAAGLAMAACRGLARRSGATSADKTVARSKRFGSSFCAESARLGFARRRSRRNNAVPRAA